MRTLQKQKGPGEWLRGAFVDGPRRMHGCTSGRGGRCAGQVFRKRFIDVCCRPGGWSSPGEEKKTVAEKEGRIVASAHAMRKRRAVRCGAKPTRNKSASGCESKRERAPYSIQAHRASELLAVSTDTSRTILSRSLQ
ncbi:hypothetical protein ACSFB7_09430 [Variovorax sp. GB1P17]